MGPSKRGGWRPGSGRKPSPDHAEKVERIPSSRGGVRPGAGRKFKPRRVINDAELLTYIHKVISPADLARLFDQARAGNFVAVQEIHALFVQVERAAQAALAAPACADLFPPAIDLPDGEEKP